MADIIKSYLAKNYKSKEDKTYTHTRIKGDNNSGGIYNIKDEDEFMEIYKKYITNGGIEYLTEKQLEGDKKRLCVDIDLRYSTKIKTRQHTQDHIIDLIHIYLDAIKEICNIENGYEIDVFVMEKPNVNILEDKTKDGIHIVFGIALNKYIQKELKNIAIKRLTNLWEDLPLTNTFDDVIDESIVMGSTNWILYGSTKPNNEVYKVSSYHKLRWVDERDDWVGATQPHNNIDFNRISIRNMDIQTASLKDGFVLNEKEEKEEKVEEIINNEPKIITDENIEIAELMSVEKYLLNYPDWIKTIWALKNAGFSFDFANKLSQKVISIDKSKYDETKLIELWNETKEGLGLGTIYKQAKESNKKLYYKIKIKHLPKDYNKNTDYSIASILVKECFNDKLVFCDDNLMTYTNERWYNDNQFNYLKYMISNEGVKYYIKLNKLLMSYYSFLLDKDDNDEQEHIKKNMNIINDISQSLEKTSVKTNLAKEILDIVINKHQDIEFNKNGNHFAFKNKKYNFTTKKFEDILREDYISYSAGYNYIEPEKEKIDKIDLLIKQIFPNEEIRKCYLSIMRTAFMGYTKDKFIVANGKGGNGKGVLNELLLDCVGYDYGYTGNIGALTDKKKTGSNPEIANLHKKRFCIFKEPNQKEKILLGNVKELVDNKEINARQNYSNNTKVRLQATFILECNKKLAFDGEVNDAEYRRFVDILFESTFTTNKTLLNDKNLTHVFEADSNYKQDEFKENYRCALFKYIIDNAIDKIYIPDCVAQRTKEYVDSNDELLEFMKENYVYESEKADKQFITLKDVFQLYKNSESYERLYKKERPTYKIFTQSIAEHSSFKYYYHDRKKIDKIDYRNILIGHRLIEPNQKICLKPDEDED